MMVGIAIPSFSKATKNRFGSRMKNCREIPGGRKPALTALAGRDILRCGPFHREDQEYCERPRRAVISVINAATACVAAMMELGALALFEPVGGAQPYVRTPGR